VFRLLCLSTILLAAAAPAQQPGEIVVTGRGLQEGIGEDLYDVIALDRDRLTGSPSNRLDEILKEVPGFQLFRRSDSRSANPTSQGATLRALGGNASSRALLLLDGVPQTDPFGGWISWPAYDPQRLGAVRVVRGGGSGAHGPGALAGTIELISAGPSEQRGVNAGLAYGSRDGIDARAGIGAVLGGGFASLSGAYARGHGFVPIVEEQRGPVDRRSPYEQASVSLRAVAPLSSRIELQANGLYFSDERERGTAFSDIGTRGLDASLRLVGNGAWRWSALGYVQTRQFRNSFASVNAARTSVTQASDQYSVPSTGLGARFEVRPPLAGGVELRLGGDWRETSGETSETFNFQNGAGTRGRIAGGRTRTLGAFAEAGWERDAVTVTGGARIDRWVIEDGRLNEQVLATGAVLNDLAYQDRSGWEPTGRAGLAFRPSDTVTLRAAGYLGWRLPTLNELYRPFRVGADATAANAALRPERLRGIEIGAEYRPLPAARIGATIFANRLGDGIANVTLGRGPGTFPGVGFVAAGGEYRQRQNIGAIGVTGLEIDGRVQLGPWTLSGGYAFAHARIRSDGAALPLDGLRPAQTPRHMVTGTIAWAAREGARLSLAGRYVGSQYEDDLNQQLLPDALTFDAAASIPLTRSLAIEARAENLADQRVVAAVSSAGILERATPRTLWIGVRFRD
jgi:outer membrane receptor protein involved in Fe transport